MRLRRQSYPTRAEFLAAAHDRQERARYLRARHEERIRSRVQAVAPLPGAGELDEAIVCEHCGLEFEPLESDEESAAEFEQIFHPSKLAETEVAVICHECWLLFMAWFRQLN